MTDALARLRKLAEATSSGWPNGTPTHVKRDSEQAAHDAMLRALPLLLDLVEAADKLKPWVALTEYGMKALDNYDTARAALEKVGTG